MLAGGEEERRRTGMKMRTMMTTMDCVGARLGRDGLREGGV